MEFEVPSFYCAGTRRSHCFVADKTQDDNNNLVCTKLMIQSHTNIFLDSEEPKKSQDINKIGRQYNVCVFYQYIFVSSINLNFEVFSPHISFQISLVQCYCLINLIYSFIYSPNESLIERFFIRSQEEQCSFVGE